MTPAQAGKAASGQIWGSWSSAGAAGSGSRRTAAQRVLSKTPQAPAPAACACVTSAQVEDLIGRRSGRRQDDAPLGRRGAADSARERKPTK